MKIAVILPSRGLVFSQTADELLQNLRSVQKEGWNYKIFFAHKQPIPDCFEKPTHRALLDEDVTHLWFVEDDMILAPGTLTKMLTVNKAVVTLDYPVNEKGRGSVLKIDGRVVFCGTGCLLVKREVFDELRAPYFRSDMRWNIKNYGDFFKMTVSKDSNLDGYGLHDVNFCMNLYHLGIPIHLLPGKLGQRKLRALGKAGSNEGAHKIDKWTKLVPDHLLKEVKKWPVLPTGNLETVLTPTGEINVTPSHAKTLIKQGLASKLPKRKLIVDWGSV